MTADDPEFKPRLGKIRSKGAKRARRYLQQVLRAAASSGAGRSSSAGTFHGNRIGRGAGVGRVLAARDRVSVLCSRRVIVKARIVRLKGSGSKGARLHLRYLQRDGVTREGAPGELYDRAGDRADGQAFLERGEGDRHQFRFIVAPEDGEHYADLQDFTRRLMARMEQDLGTRLDWVAVDHFNTGHPHVHVILRGRTEDGSDLVIAREYLSQGLRERAAEIVALDLGPRTDREIEETLRREVEQERFTGIDKTLLRDADEEGHCDGYGVYDKGLKKRLGEAASGIQVAGCNVHARRGFYEAHKRTGSPIAEEALRRYAQLYAIEARIRGCPADVRLAVRQEHGAP